ncbi:MAG TPA: hypothetical protein VKY33_03695 [Flavobacterium sp.]|nr:hypothetical protein [Flavobacterium sp.]
MLRTVFNKTQLLRLSLILSGIIMLTACSSLNQRPYDVDGIYNNSKIVVEDTHYKGEYYSEYFEEKTENSQEYFTDVDNYSSNYNQPYGGWGDTTSETEIVYNYPYYNSFGWGYPYGGFYGSNIHMGWSFGFGYGWGNYWGSPYYGWGYPYHYGYYGWGYPYYYQRNISRNNSYRALSNRQLTGNYAGRTATMNNRNLRSSSLKSGRNTLTTDRTFSRVNSNVSRINAANQNLQTERSSRIDNSRTNRNTRINTNTNRNTNRNNNVRTQRTAPNRSYTPAPSTRMNTGSMNRGGGMRSGGDGRR